MQYIPTQLYLQRALVQYAELQENVHSDLPLVKKFLKLNMRLFQLLQNRFHMGHRAALRPKTNKAQNVTNA